MPLASHWNKRDLHDEKDRGQAQCMIVSRNLQDFAHDMVIYDTHYMSGRINSLIMFDIVYCILLHMSSSHRDVLKSCDKLFIPVTKGAASRVHVPALSRIK